MAKVLALCGFCLNPFEREPRGEYEVEALRRTLLICNNQFTPLICDACYKSVTESATVPKNFHETPNFALLNSLRG